MKFTEHEQAHINALIERRLARTTRERHKDRADMIRLRKCFDEVLKINEVLGAHLEMLEQENLDLRRRLTELRAFQQIAMWRKNRIVSWRAWWTTAHED